jgi:hypothetical protein
VKGKLAAPVGGGVFPEAHYNSGSRVIAGVRYTAKPTLSEVLFYYRRAAVTRRERFGSPPNGTFCARPYYASRVTEQVQTPGPQQPILAAGN